MGTITLDQLNAYRAQTFHTLPHLRIQSADEAVNFVEERGFTFFWPIKGVVLPSLWVAAAGDRPVPDEHDDPGHTTWGWKDSLLGKHRWYYARVLRRRNTIISLQAAPYFYALSENYGSPEEDYLDQYEDGHLTQAAKLVYETLLREGPLDTIALRRAAHLTSRESDTRFSKALDDLQIDFKILPIGVADAGSWHYAFTYDLTHRHYPEILERARLIQEFEARIYLAGLYWHSVGAATHKDFVHVFRWRPEDSERVLKQLIENGVICQINAVGKDSGDWFALADLNIH